MQKPTQNDRRLLRTYGITTEHYAELLAQQGGAVRYAVPLRNHEHCILTMNTSEGIKRCYPEIRGVTLGVYCVFSVTASCSREGLTLNEPKQSLLT